MTNWPQTNWWETFHDAQLNQFVQQAIEHSPTMQLANSRLILRANVLVAQANSQFDPTLTATANMRRARLSRQEDYSMRGNLYSTSRGLGLNASYTFDLWGGKRAAWEAAVDAQKASEIDHQAARLTLSTDVVKNYIRLSNAYALLDLAKKDHARSTRIVEITQQLLNHGLTSEDRLYTAQSLDVTAAQVVKKRQLEIQQLKMHWQL
ncbi:TolC family protein [Vibrio sp. PP-XX7]